jgi:3-hydroxymyristoyl/3-hydroxydecanoyl-(acyl carrier protein) dehydratase
MTTDSVIAALPFEPDHPAFAGHFPGRPIIPGVQLLDRAKRHIEARHGLSLAGLQVAKFLSPAGPDMPLELEYRIAGDQVGFEIRSGAIRIASGKFSRADSDGG